MFRIDNASSDSTLPSPASPGTAGYFTDGDPVSGAPPTIVPAEWLNRVQEELLTFLTAAGITPSKTVYTQVAQSILSGKLNYAVDGGSANVYTAALPVAPVLTSGQVNDGFSVRVKIANSNTGASTLSVNGSTAASITHKGAALSGGELAAGINAQLTYDSTTNAWQLVSSSDNPAMVFEATAATTGTANAQVIAATTPGGYTLVTGNIVSFTAGNANTSAATLAVNSTAAKTIKKNGASGLVDVALGDIVVGDAYQVVYNGTYYVLIDPNFNPSAFLQSALNLSDLASASTARTNLGLGAASTKNLGADIVDDGSGNLTASLLSLKPQGRLTLSSTSPVPIADVTAATSIYYLPYEGVMVPVYNGTRMVYKSITNSGLTLALDSNTGHTNSQQTGNLYDLFAFMNGSVLTLGTGPAWSNSTPGSCARGTGAGTTQLAQENGIYVNAQSIAMKIDATTTTVSVPANQATYLGTMLATANGQCAMVLKPNAVSGGTSNILGLWNAYNRVRISALESDSTTNWTNTNATWHNANSSASNKITWVDGLAESNVDCVYGLSATVSSTSTSAYIGVTLNGSGTPIKVGSSSQSGGPIQSFVQENFYPQLGVAAVQAMEAQINGGTGQYAAGNFMQLEIKLEM